ncbi:hypothetical protein [Blastococcus sp. URHD0036]|uniref:hypothetical protein n=1 Tax=Blastococcus sp. URHD0036 TaxID=1380356 RepID=UPI00068AEE41|nr:hypothetical protein [Blastococcus sp. URHD0036]
MSRTTIPVPDVVGDTVAAMVAVVSVSAVVARLVTENAARAARIALSRQSHVPRLRPALARGAHTAATDVRTLGARRLGPLVDALLPRVAAGVMSRLDVAGLVERYVDIDRIAGRLDVDAVAARLDVDAVAARLDVDRVVDRVDIDAIAAGLDLNTLVEKVDIRRVIDRVDLDEIVARVDIGRVVERLDLDGIVARVDIDRIAARLDLDPVIARANVVEIARYVIAEIDLPAIIRSSTASVSTEVARGARDQGADADRAVERMVDRLLLRRHGRHDADPGDAP